MKYKDFSTSIWKSINDSLDLALKQDPKPIAAFDADGTLWDMDMGEAFFQYEIDKKNVQLPNDPWDFYQNLKAIPAGPNQAYLWLAQIYTGIKLEKVRLWAEQAVKDLQLVPIFTEQKKLIELFHSRGVQVYVVTASVKWAVEPGAKLLGIAADHVIGVETKVVDNKVTDILNGRVTSHEGKALALIEKTKGKKPFFVSGNTEGDLALLESASQTRLVVSAASRDDHLFKTESRLQKLAEQKNWLSHRFILD